jgi:hypothetical protein
MSKQPTTLLFASGLLLLTPAAQAQVKFSVGPTASLNLSSARYKQDAGYTSSTSYRPGFEAGLIGLIQLGHYCLQPAVLYSQKGYRLHGKLLNSIAADGTFPAPYEEDMRFNYIVIPLHLAYTQHKDGRGFQVFAGPYIGLLVGGSHSFLAVSASGSSPSTGPIKGGTIYPDFPQYHNGAYYSKRMDAGLQTGIGYRYGNALAQVRYSMGLRNLAVDNYDIARFVGTGPDYSQRVFQLSLAYLFDFKRDS